VQASARSQRRSRRRGACARDGRLVLVRGEHHQLVLLGDRERFLIAVRDEGRAARAGAADDPGEGISSKTDDQRLAQMLQLVRKLNARHQRDVGGTDTAVGEIIV
jgi:hypothetical protein